MVQELNKVAASTLLSDILQRINAGLGKNEEDYYRALASSFMLSADNAHAVHPNHQEKTDVNNWFYRNNRGMSNRCICVIFSDSNSGKIAWNQRELCGF